VIITGTNLGGATAVTFNGHAAVSFTVNSNTQITATPPTADGTGTIAVTNIAGTGTSATSFTLVVAEGVTQDTLTAGSLEIVTGPGLTEVTKILVPGGELITPSGSDDNEVDFYVPLCGTNASGHIRLYIGNGFTNYVDTPNAVDISGMPACG
jgi:IPT/TIG domain.